MTTATIEAPTVSSSTGDKLETIRKPKSMTIVAPAGDLPENFPDDAPFALLTVECYHGFIPESPRCGFPGTVNAFPEEVTTALVESVNGSTWARENGRWMVRALNGNAVLLRGIAGPRRPIWPNALPVECEPLYVDTTDQARSAAVERNEIRFAVAKAPRQWTVAVRNPRFGKADRFDDLRKLERNPLAYRIRDMYMPVWLRLDSELPDSVSVGGAEEVQNDEHGKPYAIDDERLYSEAEIHVKATLFYDLRGDIDVNVATALREYAHELLDAADRLTPGKLCRGPYLAVDGSRIVGRFASLEEAGGAGDEYQIAELVETSQAATPGVDQHEAE